MDLLISPSHLSGTVCAPPSKSAAHRAILCAALAKGTSTLLHLSYSQDIQATLSAVEALGARMERGENSLQITGIPCSSVPSSARLDCGESGSTLRFLLPIAAALGVSTVFEGHGKLPSRPIDTLTDLLPSFGVHFDYHQAMPFSISGQLRGGTFPLAGNISSQFLTGLLFATPLLQEDSEILLTTPLVSKPYVDMTLSILREFGIQIEETHTGYRIPGSQTYRPRSYTIEGDFSNAAFYVCAGILGNTLTVQNLNFSSSQGDREILSLAEQFGAKVEPHPLSQSVTVSPGTLRGLEIDAQQIPDLVPILAVTAALAAGQTTVIYNAERLRLKECDRLEAITQCLNALGGEVTVQSDRLIIRGKESLSGGRVSGWNDHRIVMSLAIAALKSTAPVEIQGAEAVKKSYPDFFQDYQALGGICHVLGVAQQ